MSKRSLNLIRKPNVYQTKEWANLRNSSGEKIVEICLKDRKMFSFEKNINFSFLGRKKFLFAEGLPNVSDEDKKIFLKKFKEFSKGYFYGLIAPNVLIPDHELFKKSGYHKVSNYTIVLKISPDENEIYQKFGRDIKRRIRKIKKEGIKIEKSSSKKDLLRFFEMYQKTISQENISPEGKEFFERLPLMLKKDLASLFIARKSKKIISGIIILHDNLYGVYNYSANSKEGHRNQSNIACLFEAIKYLKRTGRSYLDLGGYDPHAKEGSKIHSINKFKERFGGEVMEQPIYSTNLIYPILRRVLKSLGFLRGLYKK